MPLDRDQKALLVAAAAALGGFALGRLTASFSRSSSKKTSSNSGTSIGLRLARPNISNLHPYRCARDDYEDGILLDANENSLGPVLSDSHNNDLQLERYPSPYQVPLKELFSSIRGCTPSQVFVGVGSDEAIDMLFRIFCVPAKDNVITTPPTYGMYSVCAAVNDVLVKPVPLTPTFSLRVSAMLAAVDSHTKIIWVCSPGNPTAKCVDVGDVRRLATEFDGIVVLDEAYVDFAAAGSMAKLVKEYSNVVVLQTLSKAFGLAGIRCGFAIGHPSIIQLMNNVKAPYNLNSLTSEKAVDALKNMDKLRKNVEVILGERERVRGELEGRSYVVRVMESDSNFLLFQMTGSAKECYQMMADKFLVVTRYRGMEIHCEECIRVTIGKREENDAFLKALDGAFGRINGEVAL